MADNHTGAPSRFGRGWIPGERDIGLPGDDGAGGGLGAIGMVPLHHLADGPPPSFDRLRMSGGGEELSASSPLPLRGGVGGGALRDRATSREETPHPNPSPEREGLIAPPLAFTPARQVRFLDVLARSGNVRLACGQAGVSHESVYRARRRDTAFAQAWDAALVLGRGAAEEALAERALNGVEESIFYRGELVGTRRRHDARLLLAHLARLDRMAGETEAGADAARFDELLAVVAGAQPDPALMAYFMLEQNEDPPFLPPTRGEHASKAARDARLESDDRWCGTTLEEMDAQYAREDAIARGEEVEPEPEPVEPEDAWVEAAAQWDEWHDAACAAVDAALDGGEAGGAAQGASGEGRDGLRQAQPERIWDEEAGAEGAEPVEGPIEFKCANQSPRLPGGAGAAGRSLNRVNRCQHPLAQVAGSNPSTTLRAVPLPIAAQRGGSGDAAKILPVPKGWGGGPPAQRVVEG